jgi:1,2-diacylglycerol 3-beta-galactosyltransferase
LFLFSDTGGGHRSAAEAIIEALHLEFGSLFITEMVDIFREYSPPPLNYMPDWYPKMVRLPRAWGLGYKLSNGPGRLRLINASAWPYLRRSYQELFANHPSDLIVSVHPLAVTPVVRSLGKLHPPFITVVTDLITAHGAWFNRHTDLCIVPTEAAAQRATRFGLAREQVKVVGLPVSDRFCQLPGDKQQLRLRLGWTRDLPVILLVGGGEGMGPIESSARAIDASGLKAELVIIAGRNQMLKKRLEAYHWSLPTRIYGFVREMPDFMQAADILLTKAGPGTITEALNAGLPMILFSRLPGQEDGNVVHVVSEGAGEWAPTPNRICSVLSRWLNDPEQLARAAQNSHRLANPRAAREIAHLLAAQTGRLPQAVPTRSQSSQN